MPFELLKQWIAEEEKAGVSDAKLAILSTIANNSHPHARVIAIREISSEDLLFFTQKGSNMVKEIFENPQVNLTFWFAHQQKEVVIQAVIKPLNEHENKKYWDAYPRLARIRFLAYAPTSGQKIETKQELESRKAVIEKTYNNKELPFSPLYCGFQIVPQNFIFYHYRTDELSDVFQYIKLTEFG